MLKAKNIFTALLIIFLMLLVLLFMNPIYIEYESRHVDKILYSDLNVVRNGVKDQKIVALTFDDGPHPRFTPEILNLLKEYDAKATFFVLGKHVKLYPEVLERLIEEGHEVGNHTLNHIDVNKSSYEKIKKEFEDTQNIIFEVAGVKPKLFRPPFGFLNDRTIRVAEENGCTIVLWSSNQDSKDWSNPGIYKIANQVLKHTENGNIILLHDYIPEKSSHTVEALKAILPQLTKQGYRFVTVSELIEMSDFN